MKPRVVLSMEQALSLPSATLRFVQQGWRVIRIESTPSGRGNPGDPNRYVGAEVAGPDRHAYFVAPNVGKEAITLNLKDPAGQAVLHRLIRDLEVDIFCCNTVPSRYEQLGIDYATLSAIKPDLIWAAISAMGPDYPKVPGYDPVIQAMAGYMDMTGDADGPPTLAGIPIIDLKAGDEVFAGVCLALAERAETGKGKRIDVSMMQAASSWLLTQLPLIDLGCEDADIRRSGNAHRLFVPTNTYPTRDGFIYFALGNDVQWQRLVAIAEFASLANDAWLTNDGRRQDRQAMYTAIGDTFRNFTTAEIAQKLSAAAIPNAPINTIPEVMEEEAVSRKITTTTTPDGKTIRMQPMAVDVPGASREVPFAPSYGQHTDALLNEVGYSDAERTAFRDAGIIAG